MQLSFRNLFLSKIKLQVIQQKVKKNNLDGDDEALVLFFTESAMKYVKPL